MHKKIVGKLFGILKRKRYFPSSLSSRRNQAVPSDRGPPPFLSFEKVNKLKHDSILEGKKQLFILYRIIGNDLEPRHAHGQSRSNLKFILENEPDLKNCKKCWIVNRIINSEEHAAILDLLEKYEQYYIDVPFKESEYANLTWDFQGLPFAGFTYSESYQRLEQAKKDRLTIRMYRYKNNYVMNNNGARNIALKDGASKADWILPWDGNCFLTHDAWEEILCSVQASPWWPYYVVPMARITNNSRLFEKGFRPKAEEEPQLIFRNDATERFDENYPYGRRPKVEFFWRLGIPGRWDNWSIEPWDLPCPPYASVAGQFGYAGWVARLESGKSHLERNPSKGLVNRGIARIEAVMGLLDHLDAQRIMHHNKHDSALLFYVHSKRIAFLQEKLLLLFENAERALCRGPYSVVHKTTLPPSGNIHDYWHPAPYYWPSPVFSRWLPYVPHDGVRIPGTVLYASESDQYDRTRLQCMFDDVVTCALAFLHSNDQRFSDHGAHLIRCWFLNAETRMNPHLNYAQVRRGHNKNMGSKSGIIEMKDIYFLLDAVRIFERVGSLDAVDQKKLRQWLLDYLKWLQTSVQGVAERRSSNNHGTYYDLQVATIASFLQDGVLVSATLRTSRERILQQFDSLGSQPEELKRTKTAHYCCFNLQGWIYLALLAERHGEDLWYFTGSDGRGLKKALRWLLSYQDCDWPWQQIDAFDTERFQPLQAAWQYAYPLDGTLPRKKAEQFTHRLFHPHDGIRPWWFLGQESMATL